jgi:hypothetical protein
MGRASYVTPLPPIILTHLTVSILVFDRMFSLGVRGSGVDAPSITARVIGTVATPGLKRHFLYCSLKPEVAPAKSAGKNGATAAREKVIRGGL